MLWWPLIPIVFLLLGRFWCAVCPFGWLSDQVQRLIDIGRPVPAFLKRYGIWIIDASFLLITWADHVLGIVESPWGSGLLLLGMTTAVVATAAVFQRRAFCRYLCFLGGLVGNYLRAVMVTLRADADVCKTCTSRAACFNGTDHSPPCPMFEFPRTMDSSANCTLCASCVKSCPNDAITLSVRPPTRELWFVRTPKVSESFLAAAIMGIVLVQNVTMLGFWADTLAWLESVTGISSYVVNYTIFAVSLPVGLLYAASRAAALRGGTARDYFAAFGYALIPLDVAGHIAHNLFHLLAEGKSIAVTALALVGREEATHRRRSSATTPSRCSSTCSSRSASPAPSTRRSASRPRAPPAGRARPAGCYWPRTSRWCSRSPPSTAGCSRCRWPTGCRCGAQSRRAPTHFDVYQAEPRLEILTKSPDCGAWMNWPPPM